MRRTGERVKSDRADGRRQGILDMRCPLPERLGIAPGGSANGVTLATVSSRGESIDGVLWQPLEPIVAQF